MSEVVKYDNKMNLLAFKGVTKLEYDLFFSVIARLKAVSYTHLDVYKRQLSNSNS